MQKIWFPVLATTAFLVVYTLASRLSVDIAILSTLFLVSFFMVIWMVIRVLRDGIPSDHTFSERFYDDWAYTPVKESQADGGNQ